MRVVEGSLLELSGEGLWSGVAVRLGWLEQRHTPFRFGTYGNQQNLI